MATINNLRLKEMQLMVRIEELQDELRLTRQAHAVLREENDKFRQAEARREKRRLARLWKKEDAVT
jgi:hypothetical protein